LSAFREEEVKLFCGDLARVVSVDGLEKALNALSVCPERKRHAALYDRNIGTFGLPEVLSSDARGCRPSLPGPC
jgi:hypothetical protein